MRNNLEKIHQVDSSYTEHSKIAPKRFKGRTVHKIHKNIDLAGDAAGQMNKMGEDVVHTEL